MNFTTTELVFDILCLVVSFACFSGLVFFSSQRICGILNNVIRRLEAVENALNKLRNKA